MAVVLPMLFAALVGRAWPGGGPRSRFVGAAVVFGVTVVAITEALSAGGRLTAGALVLAWGVAVTIVAAVLACRPRRAAAPSPAGPLDPLALVMLLPIAGVVFTTGVLAARAWPSQWDSMVYHLPRIDHWLQDRSVAFYPTNVVRQLFNPPWSEYAMLHLIATGGDERFANAVQWLAMAGSLVGVSLIAQRLGAGVLGQIFAACFCATIPMGILQASGTQNDYVTAFWLVCMVAALVAPAPAVTSLAGAAVVGASFGLAVLTKGTAGVLGLPLLAVLWPWRTGAGAVVRSGVVAAAIALALNAPHLHRNLETFGWPLGPRTSGSATGDVDDDLVNQTMSPAIFASNVVRNASLHMGTRFGSVNAALQSGIERAHAALRLDVDDRRTTRLYPLPHFVVDGSSNDPDRSGNPVHLAILLLAAGLALVRPRRGTFGVERYLFALALAAAAFCLVFKWQPWHSRLHLPLFVLAAPLAGAALAPYRRLTTLLVVVAALGAAPPLLANYLAPLERRQNALVTPRIQQYFHRFGTPLDDRERGYVGAASFLATRGCTDVGLVLGWDDWEHPLWVLLAERASDRVRVRHVAVANPSAARAANEPSFTPCALFVGNVPVEEPYELEGRSYRLAWSDGGCKVLTSDGASAAATVR